MVRIATFVLGTLLAVRAQNSTICPRLVQEHRMLTTMVDTTHDSAYAASYVESLGLAMIELRSLHAMEGCDEDLDEPQLK